ncbi:MAG TPA: excalibur calcium-binding domain-containing protein [Allosphingosinicella sp.]|jgi:hypothetical protein
MATRNRRQAKQDPGGCGLLVVILIILAVIGKCSGTVEEATDLDNAATVPGAASGSQEMRFVSSNSLNCRSDARASAKVVSRLGYGDSVSVRQERDGWSQVEAAGTPCWLASRYLSEGYPVRSRTPRSYTPAPRGSVRRKPEQGQQCSGKRTCGEMNSCAEANFYLDECGVSRLDGDGDGVPCESICG